MYKTTTTGSGEPTAHVAVNRNRLKQYGTSIYLKNGTQFEIELFNPKQTKVLAKIYLNGVAISTAGIVLRPGQRVFLERWIDEAKKFLFETYDVENSTQAAKAIEQNGKVLIEFYDEIVPSSNWSTGYVYNGSGFPPFGGTTVNCYYSSTSQSIGGSFTTTSNSSGTLMSTNSVKSKSTIETGRAEKGESSDQSFVQDSSSYSIWFSKSIVMQILPESSKPAEVQSIRNYCTDCGTRMKNSSWKFCPSCGAKQ
jgi:hypothetical protein